MGPLFSTIIPSIGRTTLARTLRSIRDQGVPCEILTVFDAFEADPAIQAATKLIAESYGATFLAFDAGRHDTGSPQLALGMTVARGLWLLNCGDDDVYVPGAFATMLGAINEQQSPHPLMFRVRLHPAPQRGDQSEPVVLWQEQAFIRGRVTGQSFVCPNDPARLGHWVDDLTFMRQTAEKYGHEVDWRDELTMECW